MTSDNEHGWILPGSLYSVAVGGVCLGAACATPGPIFVVAATAGLGHAIGATGLGLGGVGLQKLCSRPVAREMQQTRQNSDPWTSPIQSHRLPTRSAPVWEFQETETCWVRFRDDQQKILEDAYCRNCSKLCFSKDEQKGHRWAPHDLICRYDPNKWGNWESPQDSETWGRSDWCGGCSVEIWGCSVGNWGCSVENWTVRQWSQQLVAETLV